MKTPKKETLQKCVAYGIVGLLILGRFCALVGVCYWTAGLAPTLPLWALLLPGYAAQIVYESQVSRLLRGRS